MDSQPEAREQFALQFKKLEEAVVAVLKFLGMQAADGTDELPSGGTKRVHTLHLSGVFMGGVSVLARAQLQIDETAGVILKIAVRSNSEDINELVCSSIS